MFNNPVCCIAAFLIVRRATIFDNVAVAREDFSMVRTESGRNSW